MKEIDNLTARVSLLIRGKVGIGAVLLEERGNEIHFVFSEYDPDVKVWCPMKIILRTGESHYKERDIQWICNYFRHVK
jgi:hypothetical protein